MPKRFTDTEKWKKPFIRALQAPYKLLWLYILDECDPAGMWQVDFEVAQIKIGEKLTEREAISFFAGKILILDGGTKWFIPAFIEFQYGSLSDNNRAHTKIIATLKKLNLLNEDLTIKPLTSPLQGAKEKEKERVKAQAKEEEKDGAEKTDPGRPKQVNSCIIHPWDTDEFKAAWERWKDYKHEQHKFQYKGLHSEQAAMIELSNMAKGDEQAAIEILTYTTGRGWKGFVKPKDSDNGQSASKNGQPSGLNSSYKQKLATKMGGAADQSG